MQIDKQVERKNVVTEKRKAIIEQDSSPSTSSVSLYNIESDNENFDYLSMQTPSLIKESSSSHEQGEEMSSSRATFKIYLEKHCSNNLVIPGLEGLLIYNIEEIFGYFTFDPHQKEDSRKSFVRLKKVMAH